VEQNVVVLSSDGEVRGQIEAAVAALPGTRAVFFTWEDVDAWRPRNGDRVFVIDDDGRDDAESLVRELKERNLRARIVYLAAEHSAGRERKARQAGATWYAIKPAPARDLERVIEALLRP
jgi:DNA-binding NarL/FixJ family response regulator